jgi:excisionase family DNA binding protein
MLSRDENKQTQRLFGGKHKALPKKSHEITINAFMNKRLLNVNEAAQYLGLAVDTLHKNKALREIPFVKIGRSLRFDISALDLYIKQNTFEVLD